MSDMKKYFLFGLKMKKVTKAHLLICVMSILLSGCSMHPVVSKTNWYPSDKEHGSADYLLYIEVHGEKREAYTTTTKKEVSITIWKGEEKYLVRNYICTAASLEWNVVWDQLDDLNIVFFDFPEGSSIYDEKAMELPAKQIFSLRFTYDDKTKNFSEYPVSKKILRHVKMPSKKTSKLN